MAILSLGVGNALVCALASWILYVVGSAVYNIWFHPLRKFPGPLLMRASRCPLHVMLLRGSQTFEMLPLHEKYGEVVRIAPNELAFANPGAWNDIQGHRTRGQPELEKDMSFYRPVDNLEPDIVSAGREEHGLLRRTLAHGFSDRALRDQQPLVMKYVDLLMQRLQEHCQDGGKALDLAAWYNFTTFDIIGDLAFGEPFGCLESSGYHAWVANFIKMARVGVIFQVLKHYPQLRKLVMALLPKSHGEERRLHEQSTRAKLERRMAGGKERPDLIEGLLRKKDEWGLTLERLQANSGILIIGGSETTATLLSGVTYLLLMNPEALQKATEEVRSAFKSEEDINFTSVNGLTYLLGCLQEAMRMYPPVPNGLPRVTPKGGVEICGHYVPENNIVGVHHWALYHNSKMFKNPFEFHPERFLGDAEYESDEREAFQPFHVGPRNCLGRNLAYVEMRTIMARMLWGFDLEIAQDSKDWMKQRCFNLWEKGALNVHLKTVVRA